MKIHSIKLLVETQSVPDLRAAEDAIMNEMPTAIEVQGADEGEQLTHVLAAIWIKHQMEETGADFNSTLRQYTQRVRTCIS